MLLTANDAAQFFKLMLPLQFFVNEKLGVLPGIETFDDYCALPMQKKFKVREALFENTALFDAFIDENPSNIPLKELAHVSKWKKFIRADFFIERHLKKHSILISDDGAVYAVLGLTSPLDENFPSFILPFRVKTILLPFREQIVTDGFFLPYNVTFGGGIKAELKELYQQAKRDKQIIQTL